MLFRSKRRKETAVVPTMAVPSEAGGAPSSPTGSEPKPESPPEDPPNRCLSALALIRKVLRSINCCHVENPHYIDNYSLFSAPNHLLNRRRLNKVPNRNLFQGL